MKILVLSRMQAEAMSNWLGCNTAIISITAPDDDDAVFADNQFIKGIFRIKAYDIVEDEITYRGAKGKNKRILKAATAKDLKGLKEFVDSIKDVDLLIVHCGAGISRSAAVAVAVAEYLGVNFKLTDDKHPNGLLYRLTCSELGTQNKEEMYRNLWI